MRKWMRGFLIVLLFCGISLGIQCQVFAASTAVVLGTVEKYSFSDKTVKIDGNTYSLT